MSKLVRLHFTKPGLHTTVQDGGRHGFRAFGVPAGGAMDRASAELANRLLANPPATPVLEITLAGPRIDIEGDCQIAITGADLSPTLNGRPAPMYETVTAVDGSTLSFGPARGGCRAYLAVRGEWRVKTWLGSCSAATHAGRELTPDSLIRRGSTLLVASVEPIARKRYPRERWPDLPGSLRVRVLPGPEFEWFSRYAIGHFFSRGYRLSPDSNRMGYRLDAAIAGFRPERELISSGVVPGAVQVTRSGQPIILMADAQTTGGYPRLAVVVDDDLDRLAQLRPGDEVWFELMGNAENTHHETITTA